MADQKERVAKVLSSRVKDGDVIGLGSGSTAELAISQIGARIRSEGIRISGIPTSHKVSLLAESHGIQVLSPISVRRLTWAFDGADEVDGGLRAIKGQGAAMLGEKIVARRSERFVIIVTEDKIVSKLGSIFPIPLEVIPEACGYVESELKKLGARETALRTVGDKKRFVVTEHNNLIVDAHFDSIGAELDTQLKCLTGVVEHGLFVNCIDEVLVSKGDKLLSLTIENGKLAERSAA